MRKIQKKQTKVKLLIAVILLVFMFSIVKVGISLASIDTFTITSVDVLDKASTADINNFSFEKNKIIKDITFHHVGDYVTYKIKVKNNEETNYTIKSVSDDNESKYISYVYDSYEGTKLNSNDEVTFEITEKYIKEVGDVTNRNQNFSVNITFTLEDEQGNVIETGLPINTSSNPQTGDNIRIYISTAIASFLLLIFVYKKRTISGKHYEKHSKKGLKLFSIFVIGILIFPSISKAVNNFEMVIKFENNILLKDRLTFSYTVGDEEITENINYNEKVTNLDEPEKEGYEFTGWKKEDGTKFNPEEPIIDDTKIVADFKPITYTISYELNGGQVENENSTTYTVESDDILLNKPTKEGYTFTGWTGTGLQEKTKEVTIPKGSTENKEYTANYDANTYEIVFDGNTGSGSMTNQEMKYDVALSLKPNEFTKTGYTFKEWNTRDDGTGISYLDGKEVKNLAPNGEVTLYAIWNINNYTVTFMHNGNEYDKQTVRYNEQATEPTAPQVDNVEFLGWYLVNSLYDFSSKVTANIELITRFYEYPTVSLSLDDTYIQGKNVTLNATYTVDSNYGLKSLIYYYYKNGTKTVITNLNSLLVGDYTIYAELTDNRENTVTSSDTTRIVQTLYNVASVGDYVQYNPTSTYYTSTTYDGITGSINPSTTTSWRVLSKNSDGTIDIIPTTIAGKLNYGGDVHQAAGSSSDVDNIVYAEYENSLQLLANSFINSTFATSARAVTENDFTKIKNTGLVISDNYAINKKDYTSRSWTGNGEGGANWNYYIYYANVGEIKQFETWYKYAGTGGQSSTAYEMELGVRPIVRLKAGVLEGSGNGANGNPWTLTQ